MSRPLRQPREELRQSILDAARGILDREGMEGLSARAIAREIDYTAATIYNVFSSMSDIVMEINRETLAEVALLFSALPKELSAADRLRALSKSYVCFMQDNPARWNALFGGNRERESFPNWYTGTIEGLKLQLAHLLIEHAGDLDRVRAEKLAEHLFVSVHGALTLGVGRRLDLLTQRDTLDVAMSGVELVLNSLQAGAGKL